jgi:UPF0271 protein
MTWKMNINSDMGEGFGRWRLGPDEELISLIPLVPTVSVACGFHAGDARVMHRIAECAVARGTDIGAHVGLPGLRGYGRRPLDLEPADLRDEVLYQMGALDAFVRAEGGAMRHIKPHGTLRGVCARREEYARAVLEAVARYDDELIVVVGRGWPWRLAEEYGLTVVYEGYLEVDHRPEDLPRAAYRQRSCEPDSAVRRALAIAREYTASVRGGFTIDGATPTLCLRGDMPNILEVICRVRDRLAEEEVEVVGLSATLAAA